ncbi:MAG: exodeoxyribonuclease VII small subunit [Deltaproteobacteria bacterium RBG_16_54_11]|nr:MAG: exodeoxyribonuclease VII small subunit [Deltaproteobacteria bacterium RBG_16_54_11]
MKKEKAFEEALRELEEIVNRLEQGEIPLEEALQLFEQGVKLSRSCHTKLDEAQKRVEIVLKDEGGKMTAQPFKMEEGKEDG